MTRSPKIVTIFGATGTQGGSVAQSLLQNKDFQVRAISRDPESPRAQELERLGATIVKANGWNKDEITDAFKGSWGAFVNTNSDDPVCLGCYSKSILEVIWLLMHFRCFWTNKVPRNLIWERR